MKYYNAISRGKECKLKFRKLVIVIIYLDNAATTQIDPTVFDAMLPFIKEQFGNPGAIYGIGRNASNAIKKARKQVADFIGADPSQIIFTSGGTEANNMVMFSLRDYLKKNDKTHIIVSSIEHDSLLFALEEMCCNNGFEVTYLGVDDKGLVNPEDLRLSIRPETGLVSIMYVNNEVGSENQVSGFAKICREKGVLFHTDCVQAAGSSVIDVRQIDCDFLSLSSHKIHGPKGAGALYARNIELMTPMIHGGRVQEFGLRGGTENVSGIVGFGMACEIMMKQIHEIDIHNSVLKQLFFNKLEEKLSEYGIKDILHINGESIVKHGKVLNIRFDGIDGETLLLLLDSLGVCVSAGAACRSHESDPSHVLLAMGISPDDARSSIRVSFSKMNSNEEVVKAAEAVAQCVKALYQ